MVPIYKTTFRIAHMDCPCEEQLIKMKLSDMEHIRSLQFDIPNRLLHVFHTEGNGDIFHRLNSLNLNTSILSSVSANEVTQTSGVQEERKALWIVLFINFLFFVVEIIAGLIGDSMALIADSLDMLADSMVYALALFAVGGSVMKKKRVAVFAGYFQIALAFIGLVEVIRRFIGFEKMPDFNTMIIVSILALMANMACLYILQKRKSEEAHIRASLIFTSNDIIINSGVIVAGLLVNWLESGYPDLIIGALVFIVVARGAVRILRLAR